MASHEAEVMRVESLGYRYGPLWALESVDLTVRSGEALAVLGPNGAGKSTLIANVLGLITPTRGTVRLCGVAPEAAVKSGRVAGMLQGITLPAFATVGELLSFTARLYPRPLPVAEAVALAGVGDFLGRPAARLSGGQRRRVQFAMALVANADFLFLDEPTDGLDIEARASLWQTVRAHADHPGRAVVFTTHDLSEADRYADRIVLLARGRVIAVDTPAALKARLAGRRVRFEAPAGLSAEAIGRRIGMTVSTWAKGFEIVTDDTDRALRALVAPELGLRRFATVEGTLDEVFRTLVDDEGSESRAASGQ
jgi:ABC-2 type transport system ATP-binding protein